MEVVLNGLYNFLKFVATNWGMIVAIVVLIGSISKKITSYLKKSQDEKLAIAKAQISETMLKWVSLAECDWRAWQQAGGIKRSQVIDQIFAQYPILSKVTDQDEIIAFLDKAIDEALKNMRKIFEENAKKEAAEVAAEPTTETGC